MKICYFFSNIHLGKTTGQSGIALSLIKKIQEKGHKVYIVSNYENKLKNFDLNQNNFFLIKGSSTFKTYVLNSYKIIRYLKKTKPDIIYIQGHLLIPFVYFLNKITRNRIIYTLPESIDNLNILFQHLIVYCIKKIGSGFVLSQNIKKQLVQLGASADRIFVIHIGLSDLFLLKIPLEKYRYEYDILYFGDTTQNRGFDVLYNLAKKLPDLKFKLIIRWQKEYQEELNKLRKFKNVSVLSSPCLDELKLKQFLLKSKLVVLPYRWMGVQPPLTLLEAMALGKCVLTSTLPGSRELIIDNKNAVLIGPDGSINKIIEKIKFLLNNPAVIKKIGQNANKTILKHYSSLEYNKVFIVYEMIVNNFYEWRMFGNIGGDFVSRKEINILLDLLQPKVGDKVLDAGTGSGRFARAIAQRSKAKVIGLDPDKKILKEGEILRKIYLSKIQQENYKTALGNGQDIKFSDNSFDKVFSFRALKYYPDPYKGIDELYRVLKKEGILVLEMTSNKSWEAMINPVISKIFKKRKISHFWEKDMINFNSAYVKEYLLKNGMVIIDEKPLHKIPPRLYSVFNSQYINYLLDMLDKVLLKITPKHIFSKSIIIKCKKL